LEKYSAYIFPLKRSIKNHSLIHFIGRKNFSTLSNFEPVAVKTITNIHTPVTTDYSVKPPSETGHFPKFSVKAGTVVSNDSWDKELQLL
jgi:hypothetical protein